MKARASKKPAKNPITATMFHDRHPDIIKNSGELFYARVANRVYAVLADFFGNSIDHSVYIQTAIDIAAYLEDKVTGLGLWNAYEAIHREKYGTSFPFYDISHEERYENEPNQSDVRFLIGYDINRYEDERTFNFLAPILDHVANDVFEILVEEFENAPGNTPLYEWVHNPKAYEGPKQMRERLIWLVYSAYLTSISNIEEVLRAYSDMAGLGLKLELDDNTLNYMMMCSSVMLTRIGPAAEPSYRWLCEMLRRSDNPEVSRNASRFNNFRATHDLLFYMVESVNKRQMTVKTLNEKTITISFDMLTEETKAKYNKGDLFITHLFFYNNCWQINGISNIFKQNYSVPFDESTDIFIKENAEKRHRYEASLKFNDGKPIGVARDYDSLKRKLKLNKIEDLSDEGVTAKVSQYKNILYFIPKNGTLQILPDLARAVKLPYNRLYNREYALVTGMILTLSNVLPNEMRNYLISNNLLPDSLFKGATDDKFNHEWYRQNRMCLNDMFHTDTRIRSTFETYDTLFDD